MVKIDIVKHIEETYEVSGKTALKIVNMFIEHLKESIVSEKTLTITGLGRFEVKNKSSRPGVNIKAKKIVTIPERKTIVFHTGEKLKSRL